MALAVLEDVVNKSYDYIVIGGGTAGLCLAARLSEDQHTTVLVLEAGQSNLDDPAIQTLADRVPTETVTPGLYGSHFGQPGYDWAFKTVPQKHANGTVFGWHRGKGLGGSSAINFSAWVKPPKEDIDDWQALGNPGWNWTNYAKYSRRTESLTPFNPTEHGSLKIAYPRTLLDVDIKMQETLVGMGIPKAKAPRDGDPSGTCMIPNTLDLETNTRSYSATAFYIPNSSRPNLSVLCSAYVHRIVTEGTGDVTATGVEFTHSDTEGGDVYVVHAGKEVLLCAGALKSPQILELSGIGCPDVLDGIGVPVKVPLDGVGKNVQEHLFVGVSFELKQGLPDETYDVLREPGMAEKHTELHAKGLGIHTMGVVNFTFQPLEALSEKADAIFLATRSDIGKKVDKGIYSEGLAEQYRIQLERLERGAPGCEIIGFPGLMSVPNPPENGKKYYSILAASNHNLSRGTIHSTTKDAKQDPAFDPHYFEEDIDLQTMIEIVKFIRKVPENAPFKDFVDSPFVELNPGPGVETDAEIREWLKSYCSTTFHTIGSLSMLPLEKGGVVDPKLKVYGTKHIRVVDLSIVPLHFAAHSQSTAYAIAEQAADIIKGNI